MYTKRNNEESRVESRIFANGTCNKNCLGATTALWNLLGFFVTLASNKGKRTRMGGPDRRAKNNNNNVVLNKRIMP